MPPHIRPEIVNLFLERLFEVAPDEHYMVITSAPLGGVDWVRGAEGYDPASHRAFPVRNLCAATGWIVSQGERRNLYVSACTVHEPPATGRRVTKQLAAGMVALWADIDVKGPGHSREDLPPSTSAAMDLACTPDLEPSFVTDTGGGLHAWWLLDEFVAIAQQNRNSVQDLSERWHAGLRDEAKRRGWHFDMTHDLARVMRIPGTYRTKEKDPTPILATFLTETMGRYPLQSLESAIVQTVAPSPTPAAEAVPRCPTPSPAAHLPIQGAGPAAAVCAALSWADILVPHGWSHVGMSSIEGKPVELWRRPDASSPYSLKASPEGWAVNWSSALDWPIGACGGVNKWRVWVWLNFGIDNEAESRAAFAVRARQRSLQWT